MSSKPKSTPSASPSKDRNGSRFDVFHRLTTLAFAAIMVWFGYITLEINIQASQRQERAFRREDDAENRDQARSILERLSRFREHLLQAERLYCESTGLERSLAISTQFNYAAELEPGLKLKLESSDYVVLCALGSYFGTFEQARRYGEEAIRRSKAPLDCYVAELVLGHVCFRHYRESGDQAHLEYGRNRFQNATACLCASESPPKCKYFEGKAHIDWGANELACGHTEEANEHFQQAHDKWIELPDGASRVKEIANIAGDFRRGIMMRVPCPSQLSIEPDLIVGIPPKARRYTFKPIGGELLEPAPELAPSGSETSNGPGPAVSTPVETHTGEEPIDVQEVLELGRKYQQALEKLQSQTGPLVNLPRDSDPIAIPTPTLNNNPSVCSLFIVNRTSETQYPFINGQQYPVKPHDTIRLDMTYGSLTTRRDSNSKSRVWGESFWVKEGERYSRTFEITGCCFHPLPRF